MWRHDSSQRASASHSAQTTSGARLASEVFFDVELPAPALRGRPLPAAAAHAPVAPQTGKLPGSPSNRAAVPHDSSQFGLADLLPAEAVLGGTSAFVPEVVLDDLLDEIVSNSVDVEPPLASTPNSHADSEISLTTQIENLVPANRLLVDKFGEAHRSAFVSLVTAFEKLYGLDADPKVHAEQIEKFFAGLHPRVRKSLSYDPAPLSFYKLLEHSYLLQNFHRQNRYLNHVCTRFAVELAADEEEVAICKQLKSMPPLIEPPIASSPKRVQISELVEKIAPQVMGLTYKNLNQLLGWVHLPGTSHLAQHPVLELIDQARAKVINGPDCISGDLPIKIQMQLESVLVKEQVLRELPKQVTIDNARSSAIGLAALVAVAVENGLVDPAQISSMRFGRASTRRIPRIVRCAPCDQKLIQKLYGVIPGTSASDSHTVELNSLVNMIFQLEKQLGNKRQQSKAQKESIRSWLPENLRTTFQVNDAYVALTDVLVHAARDSPMAYETVLAGIETYQHLKLLMPKSEFFKALKGKRQAILEIPDMRSDAVETLNVAR
jgi:hypothetical protein